MRWLSAGALLTHSRGLPRPSFRSRPIRQVWVIQAAAPGRGSGSRPTPGTRCIWPGCNASVRWSRCGSRPRRRRPPGISSGRGGGVPSRCDALPAPPLEAAAAPTLQPGRYPGSVRGRLRGRRPGAGVAGLSMPRRTQPIGTVRDVIRAVGYRRVSTVEEADTGAGLLPSRPSSRQRQPGVVGSRSKSTPTRLPRASHLWVA